ncbi:MAG: hypothetical protein WBH82_08480 [Arcanobacterium sp.]
MADVQAASSVPHINLLRKATRCSAAWIGIGAFLIGYASVAASWALELVDTGYAVLLALLILPYAIAGVFWTGRLNRLNDPNLPAYEAGDFVTEKRVATVQALYFVIVVVVGAYVIAQVNDPTFTPLMAGALVVMAAAVSLSLFRVNKAVPVAEQMRTENRAAYEAVEQTEAARLAVVRERAAIHEKQTYREFVEARRPLTKRQRKALKRAERQALLARIAPLAAGGAVLVVLASVLKPKPKK